MSDDERAYYKVLAASDSTLTETAISCVTPAAKSSFDSKYSLSRAIVRVRQTIGLQ